MVMPRSAPCALWVFVRAESTRQLSGTSLGEPAHHHTRDVAGAPHTSVGCALAGRSPSRATILRSCRIRAVVPGEGVGVEALLDRPDDTPLLCGMVALVNADCPTSTYRGAAGMCGPSSEGPAKSSLWPRLLQEQTTLNDTTIMWSLVAIRTEDLRSDHSVSQ